MENSWLSFICGLRLDCDSAGENGDGFKVLFEARTDRVVMSGMWGVTDGENGGVLS